MRHDTAGGCGIQLIVCLYTVVYGNCEVEPLDLGGHRVPMGVMLLRVGSATSILELPNLDQTNRPYALQ